MKSIRKQFTWILIALGPGWLIIGFLAIVLFLRQELKEQFLEGLTTKARVIAEEIKSEVGFHDLQSLRKELEELESFRIVPRYFAVFESTGDLVSPSNAYLSEFSQKPAPPIPFAPQQKKGFRHPLPNGQPGFAITIPFEGNGDNPDFVITVMEDSSELDETIRAAVVLVLIIGVLFVLSSLFLVPWFLKRGFQPFESMREEIESIDSNTLDRQVSVDSMPLEFRPFVQRFNELLFRLNSSFERERRVNADLAHEIRNPVAELKLILESCIKWPESREAKTDRELLEIVEVLEQMVEKMLELARSESGLLEPNLTIFDVETATRGILKFLEPEIGSKKLKIDLIASSGAIKTDAILFESILNNLIQNAIRYAPENSCISIDLSLSETVFLLEMRNPAPDLTESDLLFIKERYWRKKESREDRHLGIGTTLVKAFVEALGGRLSYALSADRVLSVSVELPIAMD